MIVVGDFCIYAGESCLVIAVSDDRKQKKILTKSGSCLVNSTDLSWGLSDDRFEVLDNYLFKETETGLVVRDMWLIMKILKGKRPGFHFEKAINVNGKKCEYPVVDIQIGEFVFVYDKLHNTVQEFVVCLENEEEILQTKYVYRDRRSANRAKTVINELLQGIFA